MRVAHRTVPGPSAEGLVDGNAQGLALDVPKRKVHGRDSRRNGVPGGEEGSPKEQVPEVLGAKRILTQEERFEVLDSPCYRQLAAGEPRFADAVVAGSGARPSNPSH